MRVATWNVNSVKQRLPRLLPWLDQRQPDVVCLQETKLADEAFSALLGDEPAQRGYAIALHGEPAWRSSSRRTAQSTSSTDALASRGRPAFSHGVVVRVRGVVVSDL